MESVIEHIGKMQTLLGRVLEALAVEYERPPESETDFDEESAWLSVSAEYDDVYDTDDYAEAAQRIKAKVRQQRRIEREARQKRDAERNERWRFEVPNRREPMTAADIGI